MSNIYTTLLSILPKPVKRVGEIVSLLDAGRYLVTLDGGGQAPVKGASGYTVGAFVFISDDVIEGVAPSLPSGPLEIF